MSWSLGRVKHKSDIGECVEEFKECKRIKLLIKHLKTHPTPEPYYSIQLEALETELYRIGQKLKDIYRYKDFKDDY